MISLEEYDRMLTYEKELCAVSLADFAELAYPILEPTRTFVPGWHIDAICEHLEACVKGEIRNLVINMPPRHMKSLLVSVLFPAWIWINRPESRFLVASYAESLSVRDSVKTRRVIQSPWYQSRFADKFNIHVDQNEKRKFENDKTGYRMATSVGGVATGEGGDFIIVDDPHKVGEKESKLVRETAIRWWDEEMSTRGNDPETVVRIIVMQRVHEADLSGHVLQQGGYEHLCLPAEYESTRTVRTSIGWEDPRKEEGELLWPKRFTKRALDELKLRMGSNTAAGQLQQRPAPQEGNIFKRHHWKFYNSIPTDLDKIALSADLTFKDGEKTDFTVMQVWGKKGADKFLLDQTRGRMGFNGQIAAMKSICEKWIYLQDKWVEEAANGAALIDVLKNQISGLIPVPPRGSKEARAESIAPQQEAGNLYLPNPSIAPWINDYIEELAVFPNGVNDDQVDATSLAVSQLTTGLPSWMPISITGNSKWLR